MLRLVEDVWWKSGRRKKMIDYIVEPLLLYSI